jgi:tetratricopeptide (TPR) repeat protein
LPSLNCNWHVNVTPGVNSALLDDGNLEDAAATFRAGLAVAPRDHLLHTGLSRVFTANGEMGSALTCLCRAGELYPVGSYDALKGAGRMLLDDNRPRAALRRFERVLELMDDRDLLGGWVWMPLRASGWGVRVDAARCALICADNPKGGTGDWSRSHLPAALIWLRVALVAAPQDGRLLGMLSRTKELLAEARGEN